jgi:hypothetical protein
VNILVFGVGAASVGVEYQSVLSGFNIVAYLDNDSSKWNSTREGRQILSPRSVAELDYDRVLITSGAYDEMHQQLLRLGVPPEKIFSALDASSGWKRGGRHLIYRLPHVDSNTHALSVETIAYEVNGAALADVSPNVSSKEHTLLVQKLWNSLLAAERDSENAPAPYRVGKNWHDFLVHTRPEYFAARQGNDVAALEELLANFFRNNLSTGILGGRDAFDAYAASQDMVPGIRANFNVWSYSVAGAPVSELELPPIGNPYGHYVDGYVVHPNTFLNHYRGRFAKKIVAGVSRPVVAEIGGGFGGFAYYVLKFVPGCCYINFDLPENLIISTYFLSLSYPDLRIYTYSGGEDVAALIDQYDVILMPQYSLPSLPDRSVDLFVNTISMSEMDYATICEYLNQISRVTDGFFYHENLIANGTGYLYYPIDTFPTLPEFNELLRQPSRWPYFSATSPFHCHMEQLYVRKDRIRFS